MPSREQQFEEDRAVANKRLSAAVAESTEIHDQTERLRSIQRAINAEAGNRDIEARRAEWFNENVTGLVAWASGSGTLPSLKPIDKLEYEARVLNVALGQTLTKLLIVQARMHASRSEELECLSRLRHIDALESHFKTEEFLKSGAEIMGVGANVDVNNSAAERLQIESDLLLKEADSERRRAEEIMTANFKKGGR
jgi:hypothetical protein